MEQQQRIFPVTEHDFILPSGHRMHYQKAGVGPPLLLIHGLAASCFSWRHNLPAFAPHFTCYAVDVLGLGDSDRPVAIDVSPRSLAEGLIAFMRSQSLGPWSVIGTSHGGGIAMWIARLAANAGLSLARLVLVASINPWSRHGRRLAPLVAHPITVAIVKASRFAYVPVRRWSFARMYGDPRLIRPGTIEGYARPLRIPGTVPHCMNLLKNWIRNVDELGEVMRGITVPTLVIWGTKDHLVYYDSAQKVADAIPNARLVTLQGAGHLTYEERPEDFNRAVLGFLKDAL